MLRALLRERAAALKRVRVSRPVVTAAERRSVARCLAGGWLSSEAPQVAQFEQAFAKRFGRTQGVAVSSGTAALQLAVQALGLGPGDEVLMPSLTIISCAQAAVYAGAKVVPVDCDATDWNAHLRHFQARLTRRTRAIMLVHLYGLCADLDPILAWARAKRLRVIEDASQAAGLRYKGTPCGAFGDVSIFSLYANKAITTGEGGMILCDAPRLAERCRQLRNLCFEPSRRFRHAALGWNYRMSALQAAIGLPQLERLDAIVRRKRALGRSYRKAFADLDTLEMAPTTTGYADNAYWVFGLAVARRAGFTRRELVDALARKNIDTRPFFYGLHRQPALLKPCYVDRVSLPVTESLSERGLYLPSGLGLSPGEQRRVIHAVKAFVRSRR